MEYIDQLVEKHKHHWWKLTLDKAFEEHLRLETALAAAKEEAIDWKTKVKDLHESIVKYREELEDIKDAHCRVMEERCPTDEVHCTCVPALRIALATANERERVLRDALQRYVSKFGDCGEVYDQARAALERKEV